MNTNKAQHTPGPWKATAFSVVEANPRIPGETQTICEMASPWNTENYRANARLIAAAPELLEALQELEKVESSPHSETKRFLAREQARAAIAKAQGTETLSQNKAGPGKPALSALK